MESRECSRAEAMSSARAARSVQAAAVLRQPSSDELRADHGGQLQMRRSRLQMRRSTAAGRQRGAAAELRRAQRACWGGRELRPARGTTMVRVDCASLEESGGGPETGGFPTHAVHWIRSRNRFLHATQFLVVFPSLLINFLATSDFCLRGTAINSINTI